MINALAILNIRDIEFFGKVSEYIIKDKATINNFV